MEHEAERRRLLDALWGAAEPLSANSAAARAHLPRALTAKMLEELAVEGRISRLANGLAEPRYGWSARRDPHAWTRAADELRQLMPSDADPPGIPPDIESTPARAFCRYVLERYRPPEGKRFLALFQCSVGRPFSKTGSHAFMRRAVSVATGFDPARDFADCPVHVVVLASNIGPVPYELEDVYPANVRGHGVKQFSDTHYARCVPILAERMAAYLVRHGQHYAHLAAFGEGRYADVLHRASELAHVQFPIYPVPGGAEVVRMGRSRPRTYWQRYWIQLYLEIESWLGPGEQAAARERLRALDVQYAPS
jgi:hypothetical protein